MIKFERDPIKYLPRYGGLCSNAVSKTGRKVRVNPKTFELRDRKLYAFYDAYFDNTYEDWIEEGPEELKLKADMNWIEVLKRNSRKKKVYV